MASPTAVEFPSDDEVEGMTPPTLARGELKSLPWSKMAEGTEASHSKVGPLKAAIGSLDLSLERPTENPSFLLYLWKRYVETTLRYGDFLEGLEKIKALPLKDWRWHLKNKIFRVSIMLSISLTRTFLPSNSCFDFRILCLFSICWTIMVRP